MTITSAASFTTNTASGITTLSVTNTAIGDVWVVYVCCRSATVEVSAVSGGGSTNWQSAVGGYIDGSGQFEDIWIGQIAATGAQTITVTYTGSVTGITNTIDAHPFHSTLGASSAWIVDAGAGATGTSTTVQFPTLTPIFPGYGELYYGHARVPSTANTPTPAGFTSNNDSNGDPEIYGIATGTVSPTLTQASGLYSSIGALIVDQIPPPVAPFTPRYPGVSRVRGNKGPMALRRPRVSLPGMAPASSGTPSPGTASVAATAFSPTPGITVSPGVATVAVTAFGPSITDQPSPSPAAVTMTAFGPSLSVKPGPGVAATAMSAFSPTPGITVFPSAAVVAVTAFGPSVGTGHTAIAGVASVAMAAFGPSLSVTATAGVATVVAAAYSPVVAVTFRSPPSRTYTIPAESRTYVVPVESRVFQIVADVRTEVVAVDDRVFTIVFENRTDVVDSV